MSSGIAMSACGAHAIALDLPLATNNVREFRRVPGLQVENWLA
jgi:tRNA(fMet)-specific endonuclease VapC